jgi:hypothetical protein
MKSEPQNMNVRNAVRNLWVTVGDFARNKIVVVAIAYVAVDSLVLVWTIAAGLLTRVAEWSD